MAVKQIWGQIMKKTRKLLPVIAATILLMIAPRAFAQFSASVQGNVQDVKGASIGKSIVTLENIDTQVTQTTTADDAGVYRFASLAPGNYQVSSNAPGFSAAKVAFTLGADENRNVPLMLKVGNVSTSVTVTTQAPLLDTSDSRNQWTIDTQALRSLPTPSLNPTYLIDLTPGVTGIGSGTTNTFFTENLDVSANGRGNNGNQYILDGLDINIDVNPGVLTVVPNSDAVSELSVQTNTYSVDFGKASSIQTVITTKAGTTQYHGVASELYTYQGLNARGEFGTPQPQPIAPFHANDMSFYVGGPVFPKHKFFFYGGVEPLLSLASNGNSVQTYEDPAFVAFAQQAKPNSPEVQMLEKYKPTGATTTGVAATAQDLFGPQNSVANTGCATPSTDNIPCSTPVFDHGNFNSSSYNNANQYNLRIDKYFSKDRIYGTLLWDTASQGGPSIRPAFAITTTQSAKALQGSETHDFSPNTLNEAYFGYNYLDAIYPASGLFTVPIVNVSGLGVGFGDGFALGQYAEHNYHWRDVLTHIYGAHAFKVGYEGWHGDDLALFAAAYGQPNLTYNNMIDLINNNPYSESGLSYNVVTGKPQPGQYEYAMTTHGAFYEDTWKVNKTVTLNYGVRYDNFGNPYPIAGTTLANFHLGSGSTMAEQVTNGVMKQQGHVYNKDMNWVFSPRAGVAWDPTGSGKWVIRGGIGVYHDWVTLGNAENNLKGNPPGFVIPTFYNNGSTAPPIFSYGTQNTYPFGFQYPAYQGSPLNAQGGVVGAQFNVGGVDVKLRSPWTTTWSATLERQIGPKLVASIGYVGQHSGSLLYGGGNPFSNAFGGDVNVYAGDLIQHLTCTPVSPPNGQQANCAGTQTRLNQSFGAINYTFNGPWSNYSGLILAAKGRFTQRGFVTASYTRSSSKDNSGSYDNLGYYPIEYPLSRFYGPSGWDAPNRVSIGWSYELPGLDKGSGLKGRLTSGWMISSNTVLQSGFPFSVYTGQPLDVYKDASGNIQFNPDSGDFNADGDNIDYPNVSNYHNSTARRSYINGLFQHCAGTNLENCGQFTLPQVGQEGSEKINLFRNPGYAQVDASLKKTTNLTWRVQLELRVDWFNLFNRVNLLAVDPNAQDGTNFGISTGTQLPRQGQLGARIEF